MSRKDKTVREDLDKARREWREVREANRERRDELAAEVRRRSEPPPALAWGVELAVVR